MGVRLWGLVLGVLDSAFIMRCMGSNASFSKQPARKPASASSKGWIYVYVYTRRYVQDLGFKVCLGYLAVKLCKM